MLKFLKNKKIFLALIVILVLAGGIFVWGASVARAAGFLDIFTKPGEFVLTIVANLLQIIMLLFSKLLALAAALLDGVFEIGKFRNIEIVNIGWQITRGLCNMFFALILLVMALSTILQIEKFGMKQILKRLVIAALLINFSLLFAGIIIDFSQVLTGYFIDAAKGNGTISTQLVNGLSIANIYNTETISSATSSAALVASANAPPPPLGKGMEATFNIVIGMVFGIIVIMVATFTVLAAAILLIFRIVALWLLLIFAPLAWLSMITGTGGLWGRWWKEFFKWTFFAPIYAFFIYLAVLAVGSGSFSQAFQGVTTKPEAGIFNSLAGSTTLLLQYVVIIIILMGGLIAAQEMGIKGAGAAMDLAKKASGKVQGWAKGSAKWTGKQALRPARFGWQEKAAPWLTDKAGGALKGIGFKKWGGRTQAAAVQMKQKPEERPENKDYAARLKFMSDKDLLHETKSAWGARALIAAREAKERGTLGKTDDKESVKKAMQTFAAYGAKGADGKTKEQRDLEETRFDVLEEKEQKDAIRRSYESGNLSKVNAVVFKDKETTKAMADELSPPEFVETYKKLNKAAKFAIKGGKDKDGKEHAGSLSENFDSGSNFSDTAPDMKYRRLFAAATGNLAKSFTSASEEMSEAAESAAAEFVKGMKASQIGDIFEGEADGRKSLEMVGRHIDRTLLASTTGELNAMQKQLITGEEGIKKNKKREDLEEYMSKSPAWGGRVPDLAGQQTAGGTRPQPQRPEQEEGPGF